MRTINSPEFSLIKRFVSAFDVPPAPGGPGDDCAVVRPRADLCITTDAVVEGVHFTLRSFSFEDIGHKALAVNLSDLAAMGARPRWFLCAIALPTKLGPALSRIAVGMRDLSRQHAITLIGGNLSRARELSITITAAGELARGRALTRAGGHPGDRLYVSGTLGDARLGLSLLERGLRTGAALRQLRPIPRIALGQICARYARAAIDISDGFTQDLTQLCLASQVGARVEVERLPISEELRRRAGTSQRAVRWALQGGEDYELLVAVPANRAAAFERRCARAGERVSEVGSLTEETHLRFVSAEGSPIQPPHGFDHFVGLRSRGI